MKVAAYILCAMLLVAVADMPYGYYTILKLTTCTFFVYIALNLPKSANTGAVYLAWALATTYNPLFRIPLGKELWSLVNVITVIACVYLARKTAVKTNT